MLKFGNAFVTFAGSSEPPPETNQVVIGNHVYTWVVIGNRRWLTENLYEPLSDFAGNDNATDRDTCWADFTNRDNRTGWGILYYTGGIVSNTNNCRTQLNAILSGTGFRVPTYNDFEDLLAVSSDWRDYMVADAGGNDSLGFHGKNAGNSARDWNYAIQQSASDGSLQVVCDNTSYNTFVFSHQSSSYRMVHFYNNTVYRDPIRLCADLV